MGNGLLVEEFFEGEFQWVGGGEGHVSEEEGTIFGVCENKRGVW